MKLEPYRKGWAEAHASIPDLLPHTFQPSFEPKYQQTSRCRSRFCLAPADGASALAAGTPPSLSVQSDTSTYSVGGSAAAVAHLAITDDDNEEYRWCAGGAYHQLQQQHRRPGISGQGAATNGSVSGPSWSHDTGNVMTLSGTAAVSIPPGRVAPSDFTAQGHRLRMQRTVLSHAWVIKPEPRQWHFYGFEPAAPSPGMSLAMPQPLAVCSV